MDTSTLVALIAAGTSLAVSSISVLSAIINTRNSASSAKEIETLKHKLDMEQQVADYKRKYANEVLSALTDSIKSIQKVKDVIQPIVDSYNDSHLSKVAISNITQASKDLVTCYEERFTELVKGQYPEDKEMFHAAKGLTFHIENYVISALSKKAYTSDLSVNEKNQLRKWRNDLSEIQIKLQNSLYDQFIKCNLS